MNIVPENLKPYIYGIAVGVGFILSIQVIGRVLLALLG